MKPSLSARMFALSLLHDADDAFCAACEELFRQIEQLRPEHADEHWLIRPDFDWTELGPAIAFAEGSSQHMGMFASMRYLAALGSRAEGSSRLMNLALNQIRDVELLERVLQAARLIAVFCERWQLPPFAPERIVHSYTNRVFDPPRPAG